MKVLDLSSYRQNKNLAANTSSRQPLYSSHLDSPPPKKEDEDFGLRMQRIRESLEHINQLMFELKRNTKDYTY